jgi:hypothetical protein
MLPYDFQACDQSDYSYRVFILRLKKAILNY